MRLVIFDFDGTIYRGETLRLFLRVLAGKDASKRRAVRWYYAVQAPAYLVYRLGVLRLRMMGRAMRGLVRMLAGMSEEELAEYFRSCLVAARPRFRPEALARLHAHLAAGDAIVLLSGAFSRFLALVAGELRAEYWLGSDLPVSGGRCTGRMGRHTIGRTKVRALQEFLREQELAGRRFDLREACAYADGLQDLPLLSLVGQAVAVAPGRRLKGIAERRGWEII